MFYEEKWMGNQLYYRTIPKGEWAIVDPVHIRERLKLYENPKNWTRPYDYQGKLLNEHCLYKPKLEK